MKVYILSWYDEHGAKDVHATTDPTKLEAMILGYTDFVGLEEERVACAVAISAGGEFRDGIGLSQGWGGMQLHIVELE